MRRTRRGCWGAEVTEVIIETQRLVLRTWSPADFPWFLAEMNAPATTVFLGGVRPVESVMQRLTANATALDAGELGFWLVALKDGGAAVGHCGLILISTPHAPEAIQGKPQIGWTITAPHWRRGYALEAARGVLAHAFGPLGHATIFSQTSASNGPSSAMMVRLGLEPMPEYGYDDPDYPGPDNPTTVYRAMRPAPA